jgi:hypothetical protein
MRPKLLIATLALCAVGAVTAHAARPALEDAEHCVAEPFHGRHEACFDGEEKKLPAELRARWAKVLKIMRMRMALLDQQGRDLSPEEEQIGRVERCSDEAFHRRHALCFDRDNEGASRAAREAPASRTPSADGATGSVRPS